MTKNRKNLADSRYHHEIWTGASEAFSNQAKSISYVENHNADWDYGLAAEDFKMAADAIIAEQKRNPNLSNWTAPLCHLVRHTMELQLKSLLEFIALKTEVDDHKILFSHNLKKIWSNGRCWLMENNYSINEDRRLAQVDQLVENLHTIDPTGDLFRFGTSRQEAFGWPKSYDRVGIDQSILFEEFDDAFQCVPHWASVVMRELIMREEGWEKDPYFDAGDFPRS